MKWTTRDVDLEEDEKESLERVMKELLLLEARKMKLQQASQADRTTTGSGTGTVLPASETRNSSGLLTTSTEVPDETRPKIPRLFGSYNALRTPAATSSVPSALWQLNHYLEIYNGYCDFDTNCLTFWLQKQRKLSELFSLAMRLLSVPASSAPVERIFSQGGLIMKVNRARMSDDTLSNLMFLKCNNSLKP